MAIVALAIGWLMATGWQSLVQSSFEGSGAAVVVTHPGALPAEVVAITLLTGLSALVAISIEQLAVRMVGRSVWPAWGILMALIIGENLGIGLRLVTLATVTLPEAVDMAHGTAPVIDLAAADLANWALAGMVSAAILSLGLVVAMGKLSEEP